MGGEIKELEDGEEGEEKKEKFFRADGRLDQSKVVQEVLADLKNCKVGHMTFGQFNIAQCFCTVIMECILELHTITCLYTFTCFITFTPFDLPTSVAKAPAPGCYLPCYLFSFLLVCWQIRGISVMRGRFDQISLFCSELNSRFLAQELIKEFKSFQVGNLWQVGYDANLVFIVDHTVIVFGTF